MTTEERLEKLEKELAREKRRNFYWRVGTLLLAGVVAIGVAALPRLPIRFNEVRAKSFDLIDDHGKTRASLCMSGVDSPYLYLWGKGTTSAGLGVDENGPGLLLSDFNTAVDVGVTYNNPSIGVYDKTGGLRAYLGMEKDDEAVLNLFNGNSAPVKTLSHDKPDERTAFMAKKCDRPLRP